MVTLVYAYVLLHSGAVLAYDGKEFNALFAKGQIAQAMELISEQRLRPIDSWRMARGHAALADCPKALELLDEAEKLSDGKINFLKRPDDFLKLKTLCLDSVNDGAEPFIKKQTAPIQVVVKATPVVIEAIPELQWTDSSNIAAGVIFMAGLFLVGKFIFRIKPKASDTKKDDIEPAPVLKKLPNNSAWEQFSKSFLIEHVWAESARSSRKQMAISVNSAAPARHEPVEPISTVSFLKNAEADQFDSASPPTLELQPFSVAKLASRNALKNLET